jgi:ABC-type multidrug transport system fused ATPase/permease subunit
MLHQEQLDMSGIQTHIHEGIGDKMGSCLQWTSGFLTGFIIGFIYGWELTLVILAISPLLAATGFVMNKVILILLHDLL